MANSILLKNCRFIVTQNSHREILQNFDILIEDGKICRIGKNLENAEEVVDCSRRIVMPALFNAHTHSPMTLLRGYRDDQELQPWLQDVWKVEAQMKPDDMYIGALYACMEMAKTGTYCFVDMYFEMEEVAKAANEIGLQAFLGYGMIDLFSEEKREKEINRTLEFVENVKDKYDGIYVVLAPHAIYTCSKELLEWVNEYSKEMGLLKTIHLSETRKEVFDCVKQHGVRPVEYLEKIGFLDNKTIIFHGSWVTKEEIKILAKRNVAAVHCPASNMKLATAGAFPMREYLEAGISVMLGTDGACSNNSLDMFREMKLCALLQKWYRWSGEELTAQQTLDLATLTPAKVFGLNSGSIEEGKDATLVFLDIDHYSLRPLRNVVSNIVYSATGNCVTDLLVKGKWVVRNGKLVNADEGKIMEKFERHAEKLYELVSE
jgi:5-methylthioadenosine/S-adenosylhomocysteine deaminase